MLPNNHFVQNFQNIQDMDPEYWDIPDLINSDDEDDEYEPVNQRGVIRGVIIFEFDQVPLNVGLMKELTGSR